MLEKDFGGDPNTESKVKVEIGKDFENHWKREIGIGNQFLDQTHTG